MQEHCGVTEFSCKPPLGSGGSKNAEYKRSLDVFEKTIQENGIYFGIAFLYDSQYNREDLKKMMDIMEENKKSRWFKPFKGQVI